VRHGTTNLFAALEVATGRVVGQCFPRRRTADFIAFMDQVAERHADRKLHVILDNLSRIPVRRWTPGLRILIW
jgi:DDE superfamily endonuclease